MREIYFAFPPPIFATFDFGASLAGGEVCKLYWAIHTPRKSEVFFSEEEAQDLPSKVFPSRLLVIHDPSRCGQDQFPV